MKTIFLIIVFACSGFNLQAQGQCDGASSLNVSTGYDPVTNSIVSAPGIDPLWRSVNLPPITHPSGWAAFPNAVVGTTHVVTPYRSSAFWNNNNNNDSGIISINNVAAFGGDNRLSSQPFRFVREFCVLEGPQEVAFDFGLKADDCGRLTLYDSSGNAVFGYTTVSISNASGLGNPFVINNTRNFSNTAINGWPYQALHTLNAGAYTLEIEMINTDGDAMGAVLSGMMTTTDGAKTLANDQGCCDVGTIYGQKVLDQDCDGTFTNIDFPGVGITVNLLDASLSIVATTVTDANGDFFFRNIPYGNYRVVEVLNDPNYTPRVSAVRNITVNNQTQSHYINFYNCPTIDDFVAPDDCCVTELNIIEEDGPVVPLQTTMAGGERVSLAVKKMMITNDAIIPITQIRTVVTDIQYEYDLEACSQCVENPSLWGSIYGSPKIGSGSDTLSKPTKGILGDFVDDFNDRKNSREVLWENPDGAMLKSGDSFDIIYALPPASEIPCCAISTRICTQTSWKDANCNICVSNICTDIDMLSIEEQLEALTISIEKEGCCERKLTASITNANYSWSTGETTQSIIVSDNAVYDVTVTAGGSSTTASIGVTDILAGAFPTLTYLPEAVPDLGNNLVIRDYTKGLNANFSYNATKYTLWIFSRNGTGSKNGAFRKIVGYADCETGFKNGDIQWDGRDDNGNKVKQDVYNFVLRLENCTRTCASEAGTCNETHNYEHWDPCLYKERTWQFPIPFPIMKCVAGWGVKNERVGNVTLLW